MTRIPLLEYKSADWNFSLPCVDAYYFDKEVIDSFLSKENFIPLILDINLERLCSANCVYCFTDSGTSERFYESHSGTSIEKLSDSTIKKVIKQFADLGGKTIFICSEGEPLINLERFIDIAYTAVESGVKVLSATNTLHLSKKIIRQLSDLEVNLLLKLESLNPEVNNAILRPKLRLNYGRLNGHDIPSTIIDCYEMYGDASKLALSSMIVRPNLDDLLDVRELAYNLGSAHFLKHIYIAGRALKNKQILALDEFEQQELNAKIMKLDAQNGILYPQQHLTDNYSFDIRRFLNNALNNFGFPLRMASDIRGGVYLSSDVVNPKFGFDTSNLVTMITEQEVDLTAYFSKINKIIRDYQRERLL